MLHFEAHQLISGSFEPPQKCAQSPHTTKKSTEVPRKQESSSSKSISTFFFDQLIGLTAIHLLHELEFPLENFPSRHQHYNRVRWYQEWQRQQQVCMAYK